MKRFSGLIVSFAMLTSACAQEPSMDVKCELSMSKSISAGQPADLVFTLANTGASALKILNWHTPFEGTKAAMFTVKHDGVTIDYQGRMFKRGAPRAQDYLELKAGERKQAKIDLSEGWDVSAPGAYTIEYSSQIFDVVSGTTSIPRSIDQFTSVTPACNSVSFTRLR